MRASIGARRALQTSGAVLSAPSRTCLRCTTSQSRVPSRLYSAAAAAAATGVPPKTTAPPPSVPADAYDIRSGLILTRAPILTRRLHPFENAYFFYQKRLEERLNSSFITDIYFKPDTARRLDWDLKVRDRKGTVAKELGEYHGKNSGAWDDELKVGDSLSHQDTVVEALLKDGEARVSEDAELIPEADIVPVKRPASRLTEADEKGDVKRLDRAMEKTLYLVVKGKDGTWGFPSDVIPEGENLHECAQRALDQTAGVNMNTWLVGRVPVAHVVQHPVQGADGSIQKKGHKTFFIKGRIMAGQANLDGNPFGCTDFKWLTREELQKELPEAYFKGVRNMMADR